MHPATDWIPARPAASVGWTPTLVLICAVLTIVPVAAQANDYTSSHQAERAADNARQQLQQHRECIQRVRQQAQTNLAETQQVHDELQDLYDQKESALEQLDSGQYCSECMRTATEIERQTGTSFRRHLDQVDGRPIPARHHHIEERAHQYDQQIQRKHREFDQLKDHHQQLQQQHRECDRQRKATFARLHHAEAMADYLRRREEAEERQQLRERILGAYRLWLDARRGDSEQVGERRELYFELLGEVARFLRDRYGWDDSRIVHTESREDLRDIVDRPFSPDRDESSKDLRDDAADSSAPSPPTSGPEAPKKLRDELGLKDQAPDVDAPRDTTTATTLFRLTEAVVEAPDNPVAAVTEIPYYSIQLWDDIRRNTDEVLPDD